MSIEAQSKAFTGATVGSYSVKTSAESDTLAAGDNSLASVSITDKLAGNKIVVEQVITVAYADVAANLLVEGSLSGTSWATLATLSSDTTPNNTGTYVYAVDLTNFANVPYIRFHFNQNAQTVGQSGKCTFRYAVAAS
tara:strand:+ start:496 stop:909 length:414 start_codon:yes stop_codon:yes gene_type:complete